MRRIIAAAFLFLPLMLHGASYVDIISNAETRSAAAAEALLQRDAGLIATAGMEVEEGADLSFSIQAEPLYEDSSAVRLSELGFSAVIEDTSLSASLPFGVSYDGSAAFVSPSASVSHAFDWGRDDDLLESMQIESSRLSVDREYSAAMLSIRSNVISVMGSLLLNEASSIRAEEELSDFLRDRSDALVLGSYAEGSLLDEAQLLEIRRAEDTLAILDLERSELEKRFMRLAGAEWTGVEGIPFPSFPDILSTEGSSELRMAELQASIAEEELLLAESGLSPSRLVVDASVSGTAYFGERPLMGGMRLSDSVSVDGGLEWEGKEWTVSASGGGSWERDGGFSPSLTIGAAWHDAGLSESEDLEIRGLRNTALIRRADYLEERRSFEEEGNALWNRILSWQRDWAEAEAEMSYLKASHDNLSQMLDRGLITAEKLHDSAVEIEALEHEMDALLLDGLSLQAEAEMHLL